MDPTSTAAHTSTLGSPLGQHLTSSDGFPPLSAVPCPQTGRLDQIDWSETTGGGGLFADDDDLMFVSTPADLGRPARDVPVMAGARKGAPRSAKEEPRQVLLSAAKDSGPAVGAAEAGPGSTSEDGPLPRDREIRADNVDRVRGDAPVKSDDDEEEEDGDDGPSERGRLSPRKVQLGAATGMGASTTGMFRAPGGDNSDDGDDDEVEVDSDDDGGSGVSEAGLPSSSSAGGVSKTQVLIGHLLMLATESGNRKQVADGLKVTGVLPPWLHSLVTEPGGPERLSKATEKLFARVSDCATRG